MNQEKKLNSLSILKDYLRSRICKSDILSNEILPFHNSAPTPKRPSPNHPRGLQDPSPIHNPKNQQKYSSKTQMGGSTHTHRVQPYLVVFDLGGGGVVPGEHGVLRAETRQGDEVLGLWHVHRLIVDAWRHANHGPTRVAEWHRVYGILHRPIVPIPVL
jgi:hypothetical protein